jgi:hypothetical protein
VAVVEKKTAGDDQEDFENRRRINLDNLQKAAKRDQEDDWDFDVMGDEEDFHLPTR